MATLFIVLIKYRSLFVNAQAIVLASSALRLIPCLSPRRESGRLSRPRRLGRAGEAYNVSDGHPTSMSDYFNRVADSLSLPRPPVVDRATAERELTASMLSFLSESKRILNTKMLNELGARLQYPDLEQGLAGLSQAGPLE